MKYSDKFNIVVSEAAALARNTGGLVCTEHLLYGMCACEGSVAQTLLFECGIDCARLLPQFIRKPLVAEVRFSTRAGRLIDNARALAVRFGSDEVNTEYLLFVLTDDRGCVAYNILRDSGINLDEFQRRVYGIMCEGAAQSALNRNKPSGHDTASDFDMRYGADTIAENDGANPSDKEYRDDVYGKTVQDVISQIIPIKQQQKAAAESDGRDNKTDAKDSLSAYNGMLNAELLKFGTDLTEKARQGKLDPVIGRSKEIERIIQILCRRTKNNPILIGEPGVGKSAVVEGLAQAIVAGNVPDALSGKIVFSLDLTSLVAGTRYRGDFEERIKGALGRIKSDGRIIVFIDEIHTILRTGSSEGGLDTANILKPMLARGELQTVGATTIDEYRRYFEQDAALERRFQPVTVEQPSVSDTIDILSGLKGKYEEHHKVEITDEAISAAAILSDRYVTDRFLPDKAIDLIDEAASRKKIFHFTTPAEIRALEDRIKDVRLQKREEAKRERFAAAEKLKTEEDALVEEKERAEADWKLRCDNMKLSVGEDEIAEIVSDWTGIPVAKLTEGESEKLRRLEDVLSKRVIGQGEAVAAVSRAIKRARAGLKDPKRPIGSFIFLGPTGVGKTELAKTLAEAMFGDENLMIRVDMSEYMEKTNVSRLIGSAPGYVGFDEGGQLTEKVRRKPYSVVLFDEIEKAHPEVFNLLLQVLEDGRLTDSHGRTVSFKNTVIIMTSNIGAAEISQMKRPLGFSGGDEPLRDYENMKQRQLEALKAAMKPELINRIDEIIIFRRLDKENVASIAELMFKSLAFRLDERGITAEISDGAKDFVLDKGYDEEYGARPLRRAIQRMIEDKLSEMVLSGEIGSGDSVYIDCSDNALTFAKQ